MPAKGSTKLISAKDAAELSSKKTINAFMNSVNKAIHSAAKDGKYDISIDNYGDSGQPVIKDKLVADSIELLLKCAGYKVNVFFDDEFGCYRFYIDWTPEKTALPIFPTEEEVDAARKRFAVAQSDSCSIKPIGEPSDPFEGYDRERFARELKQANMLLSGWLGEETRLTNKIFDLQFKTTWYRCSNASMITNKLVMAQNKNGGIYIGKMSDGGKFVSQYRLFREVDELDETSFSQWRCESLPPMMIDLTVSVDRKKDD